MPKLVNEKRFELRLREIAALQERGEYLISKGFLDERTSSLRPTLWNVQILHGYGIVSSAIESSSSKLSNGARLHHAYSTILTPSN
jgi:hypothetical protein